MPRKHPVPAEEKAICQRLQQFRMSTALSQAEFSSLVDLNHRAYVNYEWARSQVNYEAARKILTRTPWLNPIWLAEGQGAMLEGRHFDYPDPEIIGVGPRSSFLRVYLVHLRQRLLDAPKLHLWKPLDRLRLFTFPTDADGRVFGKDWFGSYLLRWLAARTDSDVNDFLNELFRRAAQVVARYPRDDEVVIQERLAQFYRIEERRRFGPNEKLSTSVLTESSINRRTGDVKIRTLDELLTALRAKTCQRGGMARLAEALKVRQARVSEWLSGKTMPGGETTLRLLHWVERQERKQTTLGSVINTTKGKIQVHKSKANEKANSNPQER